MLGDFFLGISAYGNAFHLLSKHKLWSYAFLPIVLTLILTVLIGFSAYGWSDNLGQIFTSWWPWEWGAKAVENIGTWFGGALIVIIGILSLKYIVLIALAPFISLLSEKLENKLTAQPSNKPFTMSGAIGDMIRGLRLALRNILREIFLTLLILGLGLIPILTWLSPILLLIVQSYYAGFGNADYTLERHLKLKESVSFARDNRGLMIGNGIVFMLLLMTGIGFLIAPVLSAVAATPEVLKRLSK